MAKRKFTRKKRVFKRKRSFRKRKGLGGLKKLVKKAIWRSQETKTCQVYGSSRVIYNSTHGSYAGSVFPVSPFAGFGSVTQGTGQGQRIGNRIKLTGASLKFVITPLNYNGVTNTTPQPIDVILWMFYDKEVPSQLPVQGNDFLQLGGAAQALTGTVMDEIAPVNTDQYVLAMRKVYKVGYAVDAGTGAVAGSQNYANNDYKFAVKRSVNLLKHLIKTVKYDDNNATPTTRGMYCIFEAVKPTGSATAALLEPAMVSIMMDYKYKDA